MGQPRLALSHHMNISSESWNIDGDTAISNLWVSLLLLGSEVGGHSTGAGGDNEAGGLGLDFWNHSISKAISSIAVESISVSGPLSIVAPAQPPAIVGFGLTFAISISN